MTVQRPVARLLSILPPVPPLRTHAANALLPMTFCATFLAHTVDTGLGQVSLCVCVCVCTIYVCVWVYLWVSRVSVRLTRGGVF